MTTRGSPAPIRVDPIEHRPVMFCRLPPVAISGLGIPFVLGFSGFYSKDAIIAQLVSFSNNNSSHAALYYLAAGGAALTAFYMFRLWYLTFVGTPRDQHVYEHAHESPRIMYVPLVILAVFAVGVAWTVPGTN